MKKFVLFALLALIVGALCFLGFPTPHEVPSAPEAAVAPSTPTQDELPPVIEPARQTLLSAAAPLPPPSDPRLRILDADNSRHFAVALDEVVRRDAQGKETAVPLPPQASLEALRTTAASLPVKEGDSLLPVAYEEDFDRTLPRRRIVSAEIRVELKPGQTLPADIPDAVRVQRFDFAPNFAVVHMKDSFTAMDRLATLRALPEAQQADLLLAKQQTRRTLPNDPLIANQWHLKNTGQNGGTANTDINVEPVWNYGGTGYRGSGMVVGIVDDGLQVAHPDLSTNVRTDIDHDWNDSTPDDPSPTPGDDADNGDHHGTACAGNVAAIGNNGVGVSGSAPEAKVVGLRLIAASTTDTQEAEAMAYRNDVIPIKSNSWGPDDYTNVVEAPGALTKAALKSATQTGRGGLGTVILWAGGNGKQSGDNSNNDGYANSIYTIAVGAITNTRAQSAYSEDGANLVITSPSSGGSLDITTVDRTGTDGYNRVASTSGGDYCSDFGGTSSATPTAAGAVALLLQSKPTLGWRDVQEILIKSALKVNPTDSDWVTNAAGYHFNHKYGAGLIDTNAAIALAATWTNLDAQTSATSSQTGLSVAIPNSNTTGITRTFDMNSSNIRVEQVTVRVNINHTARGNLAITLTSPGNVVSRLAETHTDAGDNFSDWTFMTVHDWGETSTGLWTLKIADQSSTSNSTGGTLTAAELIVYGTARAATNPAPTVTMTSPANGSSFSLNTPITLTATASDLTASGATGTVSRVEFYNGSTLLNTDTSSPYSYAWTPSAAGSYTLTAKAVDSEGAIGTSTAVTVTVANQPPSITSTSIAPGAQAYGDQGLSVSAVASDPEGTAVTLAYQWQSSTDGVTFANASGQTAATVAAGASNTGKVWRCVVTPSDGVNTGTAATSGTVMVLTRPGTNVAVGGTYSYTSDLVLNSSATTFTRAAIINEISQGPANKNGEWVEILTLQAGSFRNWILDDSSTADGTQVTFANSAVWDNIPAGTLIVIYNGADRDTLLPATQDTTISDGNLILSSSNTTYFSGTWSTLTNGNDGVILKNSAGNSVHQIGFGSAPPITPGIGTVSGSTAASFIGNTEAAAATTAGWRTNTSLTTGSDTVVGVTPGQGNITANSTFVSNLRSGAFNQAALFRLGSGSALPTGLTLSSAGVLSGTVTGAAGPYTVVIERYNGTATVSQTFTLTVTSASTTYTSWAAGYPALTSTSASGDQEKDGHSNLLEYFHGLDPTVADGADSVTTEMSGRDVLLHYRKAKAVSGVTEQVTFTEDFVTWSTTGITYDADVDHGTYVTRTARKPLGTSSRILLKLTVTQ